MKNPIHHLTLTVKDAEASAAWYLALLGKASVIRRAGSDFKRVRLNFPNGLVIGFSQHDAAAKNQTFSHLVVGLDHIGLACESKDEVFEWAAKIDELEFKRGPIEDVPYGWVVAARDPDIIPLEFFCAK
jgi:glyoxylase I family protein